MTLTKTQERALRIAKEEAENSPEVAKAVDAINYISRDGCSIHDAYWVARKMVEIIERTQRRPPDTPLRDIPLRLY